MISPLGYVFSSVPIRKPIIYKGLLVFFEKKNITAVFFPKILKRTTYYHLPSTMYMGDHP